MSAAIGGFIIGMVVGGTFGALCMAVLVVGKDDRDA